MCNCKNIQIGSYDNQATVRAPEWSNHHWISIDTCIVDEIKDLWRIGVNTTGCCCGHNKVQPYITVSPLEHNDMSILEYDYFINEYGVTCYKPKSV